MRIKGELIKEIVNAFSIDKEELQEIASAFRWDLEQGLKGSEYSSMRMLPAYIGMPTGKEQGELLALDLGGSNVRAGLIRLLGNSQYEVARLLVRPLVTEKYNLIDVNSSREALFGFIADMLAELLKGEEEREYYLGHTFSFPSSQSNINDARLISWTKEFAVPGVEGQEINGLLREALEARGLKNIHPVAIINDTVAELLAAAYQYPDTTIGGIYATGSNTCYIERKPAIERPAGIINMESGSFSKLMPNKWDMLLDESSQRPGEQRLEKMVSGRYMGELFSLLVQDIFSLEKRPELSAVDIANILKDESAVATEANQLILRETGEALPGEGAYIRDVARAVVIRSARLTAATYTGILWHLAGNKELERQNIAIDGSVYEHMPLIKENVQRGMYELLGEEAGKVTLMLVKDGSALGGAIAASIVSQELA